MRELEKVKRERAEQKAKEVRNSYTQNMVDSDANVISKGSRASRRRSRATRG